MHVYNGLLNFLINEGRQIYAIENMRIDSLRFQPYHLKGALFCTIQKVDWFNLNEIHVVPEKNTGNNFQKLSVSCE